MTQVVAEEVLRVIGKEPAAQGIIVPDQMPAAIAALREAAQKSRTTPAPAAGSDDQDDAPQHRVSLAQRIVPFVELLERSLAAQREVTWGL
jgi:hypothetical protein